MRRGSLYLVLGSVLAVAACSDQEQAMPTAPEFKTVPPPYACNFNNVKNLVTSYFSPPNLQTAQGYESAMESAGAQSTLAMSNGFAIMDLIGQVSRSLSPSSISPSAATVGSDLTKALTKCMFDATKPPYVINPGTNAEWNILDSARFDKALSLASGGVYYVVGADYFPPTLLNGKVGGSRWSAAAPGPDALTTWASLLSGAANTYEGNRALAYAYPLPEATATNPVYEWATIDPLTQFTPYALVSICDGSTDSTLMVHETGVGVLAYSTINLCGAPDATGTATGFRSHFSNTPVTDVHLAWIDPPRGTLKLNTPDTVTIRVTVTSTGEGVNGACMTYAGSNNNGQGTEMIGPSDCNHATATKLARVTTSGPGGAAGYVTFIYHVTKTGGLVVTTTLDEVVGRSDLITSNTLIAKTNVKP
jgi:hypothetical protein